MNIKILLEGSRELTGMAKYRWLMRANKGWTCQAIEAEFIWGPQRCGAIATAKVPALDTGESLKVCEMHFADYNRLQEDAK